ncbi:MAG TPA: AraC family transcriptional regulator [Rhizomicrobium sp.]
MSVDTLSDVLQAVRLRGAVFFDVEASAPWVAETPAAKIVAPEVMPDAEFVIEYHVVTSGSCWASVIGHDIAPVHLMAGDVVAFPQGDAHVMSSAPGMRGEPDMGPFRFRDSAQLPLLMNLDGGGEERTHLVCGFLGCDSRPFNPLLESLPRILHVRIADRGGWLNTFTQFAVMEANEKRAGGNSILSKLGELMFLDLVRRYIETLPDESSGWLAGLKDGHVGRALNLMHAQPNRDWTLDGLSREVGLSRSSFAERFAAMIGIPPMQYLQRWRLQAAASRLSESAASMAVIATEAGYESEAAFSRAFKKAVGMPPAEWRKSKCV